jgi:hypothetical protein
MDAIREAIIKTLGEHAPQTVRQVFYALTVRGVIEKTEAEYKQTVVRLLDEMRWDGDVDWDDISDASRWTSHGATTASRMRSPRPLDSTAAISGPIMTITRRFGARRRH